MVLLLRGPVLLIQRYFLAVLLWALLSHLGCHAFGPRPTRSSSLSLAHQAQRLQSTTLSLSSITSPTTTDETEEGAAAAAADAQFQQQPPQLPQQLVVVSPWESWCVVKLERLYRKSLQIRCPFFRRRASDALDVVDQVMRFLIIRHKSLPLIGPPAGWRCEGDVCDKILGLSTLETMAIIRDDWKTNTDKGYYITGRLNTTIYRDDCLFDGPDPDMPVRGLRKYLNAASNLFEQRSSRAQLQDLRILSEERIVARWRMKGKLMLPWRPEIPEWTGTTTYYRDGNGLIYKHEETWDMSVLEAFMKTFFPEMSERLWP